MRRQSGRINIWKLLVPLPLAALAIGAVSAAARTWCDEATIATSHSPVGYAWPSTSRQSDAAYQSVRATLLAATVSASPQQPQAVPSSPAHAVAEPAYARTASVTEDGSSVSRSFPHSFGPAPEPVAPSSEAALHSEPPPAVTSAPRLAPAPSILTALAPEPQIAPSVAPPQIAQPAPSQRTAPRSEPKAARSRRMRPSEQLSAAWAEQSVRSVRFDAGYYYGTGKSVRQLADELTRSWSDKGVNLIYYYAYNRVYGARYRTSYPGNVMEDFGRQDLLRYVLEAAHGRGMKVIAWFYGPQHKQMWEKHASWRQKMANGRDYRPSADSYFLCVRNPEVKQWWLGFVEEVLINYPDLDGVDISEAQIDTWGDHACYCKTCKAQFGQEYPKQRTATPAWRQFRADGLTRLLLATNRLSRQRGKEAHITSVFTAASDGGLMPSGVVRDATGFDLEAILSSADRPNVIQAELIWQQWAATYNNRAIFTPEWTRLGILQAKNMVAGRAPVIAHVEVSDFGIGGLDGPQIGTTIASAVQGDPYGIDVYDAHLIDQTEGATTYLQTAWLNF